MESSTYDTSNNQHKSFETSFVFKCLEIYQNIFEVFMQFPIHWDTKSQCFVKLRVKPKVIFWYFVIFIWIPLTGFASEVFLSLRTLYLGDPRVSLAQIVFNVTLILVGVWMVGLAFLIVLKWPEVCLKAVNSIFFLHRQLLQGCFLRKLFRSQEKPSREIQTPSTKNPEDTATDRDGKYDNKQADNLSIAAYSNESILPSNQGVVASTTKNNYVSSVLPIEFNCQVLITSNIFKRITFILINSHTRFQRDEANN
ncbi:unnamed protein product [Orchesella dallaii]|uniref:Uncharacterized protein n=1 Tax=Orchesella dallaii TaxID=48710 RepID=A0ABP1R8W2_9HEXA